MRKQFFTILAMSFIAIHINAQNGDSYSRNNPQFGLKAGINYSNVYDEVGEQFTANGKLGFVGGAFLSIPIGSFLGFQPELLFSQKGFKGTSYLGGIGYNYSRTSNFLDIPLLIALKPIEKFTIFIGPQYSYLLKQVDKFDNTSVEIHFTNDNIRKNLLCLILGFDVNLERMVIGARAGWDLQNNNGNGTSTIPRYKNVWYQATIGIWF